MDQWVEDLKQQNPNRVLPVPPTKTVNLPKFRIDHELPTEMANQKLRTVVSSALYIMYTDDGFTTNAPAGKTTVSRVLAFLKMTPQPSFPEPFYVTLADEIIEYFQQLPYLPEYKNVMTRTDANRFRACIDIAGDDAVTEITFPFAVEMPRLYGELRPPTPQDLNPLKSEARITPPDEYMGTLNQADRFFVKLQRVGPYDAQMAGYLFQITDRSSNQGYFYGKIDRYKDEIKINDCFSIHAMPFSHKNDMQTGKKLTGFRLVTIIENKGGSESAPKDPSKDATGGKFTA